MTGAISQAAAAASQAAAAASQPATPRVTKLSFIPTLTLTSRQTTTYTDYSEVVVTQRKRLLSDATTGSPARSSKRQSRSPVHLKDYQTTPRPPVKPTAQASSISNLHASLIPKPIETVSKKTQTMPQVVGGPFSITTASERQAQTVKAPAGPIKPGYNIAMVSQFAILLRPFTINLYLEIPLESITRVGGIFLILLQSENSNVFDTL